MSRILDPRERKVKIVATLGPASSSPEMIRKLVLAGADAFRINMSHGTHAQKAKLVEAIRALEKDLRRPTTILFDLQGPKLRVGSFEGGSAEVVTGDRFILDRDPKPGNSERVELPHPELFEAIGEGDRVLIDDGRVRLRVIEANDDRITAEVIVGGTLSTTRA
jgi:pyruvate kinase